MSMHRCAVSLVSSARDGLVALVLLALLPPAAASQLATPGVAVIPSVSFLNPVQSLGPVATAGGGGGASLKAAGGGGVALEIGGFDGILGLRADVGYNATDLAVTEVAPHSTTRDASLWVVSLGAQIRGPEVFRLSPFIVVGGGRKFYRGPGVEETYGTTISDANTRVGLGINWGVGDHHLQVLATNDISQFDNCSRDASDSPCDRPAYRQHDLSVSLGMRLRLFGR